MAPQLHFFIGKGGVGKSTTSALFALQIAHSSRNTLLVSMDPAHNQQDIFERPFSEKPRRVTDCLMVKQVDTQYWMEKYLEDTERQIKRTYSYQSAFNLQSCFNVLRFSPGLEEYALLLAFKDILHTESHHDIIIFDMPPTALTLRFFSLPFITLVWLEELLKIRKSIYAKKEIISKIKFRKKTIEIDKVKTRIERLINVYQNMCNHFMTKDTHINLVMNNDRLSSSESVRIKKRLNDIGLVIRRIIINKVHTGVAADIQKAEFKSIPVIRFPFTDAALFGLGALNDYLRINPDIIPDVHILFDSSGKQGFTTSPKVFASKGR